MNGHDETLMPAMVGSSRTTFAPGRILRCGKCGFGFRELRPLDEELASLYQRFDTQIYNAQSSGRSRTAELHLRIVSRYVSKPGRVLDVGCASGFFLRHALDAGWEVVGVEPSPTLAGTAQELLDTRGEIHCATLQSAPLADASFDVVTLWDVLEHVRDPGHFLRQCARVVKPGGHLIANVPDLDSIQSRILRSRWPLLLPEHLNYFNVASLRMCGEKAGLQWLGFRRRPVAFSLDYVIYRLRQHRIPAGALAQRLVNVLGLGKRLAWFPLGEICGVWRRGEATEG